MNKRLKAFIRQQKIYEMDSRDITQWSKYKLPDTESIVEYTALRILNPELTKKENALELTLAEKSPTISDVYRFDCNGALSFDRFSEMLSRYQNTEPVILYRGVSEIPYKKMIEAATELDDKDVDFYEKGFMSCSLLESKASPYSVQLKIFCLPFEHMLYVGHALDDQEPHGCRHEVILQRGARLKKLFQVENTFYCVLLGTI